MFTFSRDMGQRDKRGMAFLRASGGVREEGRCLQQSEWTPILIGLAGMWGAWGAQGEREEVWGGGEEHKDVPHDSGFPLLMSTDP